ncbi:MAG: hypothetical protein WCI73_06935 [Phycisphaerae bacterium]
MADTPPLLDYAPRPSRGFLPWQTIAAIVPMILATGTVCLCGHMDWVSMPFTMSALSLACWGLGRGYRNTPVRLIIIVVVMILASMETGKNLADILWFGHHPLLR